jgi:sporulation protein YlmC with PRC-barrel domain
MRSKFLIGGLLASVMLAPAFAQSQQTPPAQANPPAPSAVPAPASPSATAPAPSGSSAMTTPATQTGQWRASKLVGLDVYNDQNEKLGDISEILLDKSGKVEGVVIGVGGFLGMGQHDIKVELSKLKFVDEPMRTSAATPATTTGAANRPAGTTTASTSNGQKWVPDHAILSGATKEQLKNMPAFKF